MPEIRMRLVFLSVPYTNLEIKSAVLLKGILAS